MGSSASFVLGKQKLHGKHAQMASVEPSACVAVRLYPSAARNLRKNPCHVIRPMRRVLVQCAWGARPTATFLGRTFRRLEVRLGKKKAAMAVAHKILVMIYHLLSEGTFYEEGRYAHIGPKQQERERNRAIKALERLGYNVTVERVA